MTSGELKPLSMINCINRVRLSIVCQVDRQNCIRRQDLSKQYLQSTRKQGVIHVKGFQKRPAKENIALTHW